MPNDHTPVPPGDYKTVDCLAKIVMAPAPFGATMKHKAHGALGAAMLIGWKQRGEPVFLPPSGRPSTLLSWDVTDVSW